MLLKVPQPISWMFFVCCALQIWKKKRKKKVIFVFVVGITVLGLAYEERVELIPAVWAETLKTNYSFSWVSWVFHRFLNVKSRMLRSSSSLWNPTHSFDASSDLQHWSKFSSPECFDHLGCFEKWHYPAPQICPSYLSSSTFSLFSSARHDGVLETHSSIYYCLFPAERGFISTDLHAPRCQDLSPLNTLQSVEH